MADRGPFVPQRPPGNRPKPRNPTAPRDDAIIIDSDDEAEARRGSQGPGPSNDATMYELFGTPSPSPGPDPRVTLPPVPVPPPTDPETRTRRASNIYQWECRKRLPKHLQQWYETPPSTLGRTWWKCPLLNLELAQVEAQCHLRLDFTSNRFTNDLYALLHPTTASHLRTAITNPPGFFEMDFLKKIGYNVWDRALQEVTRHHNRWHLWGYRVGVLYESSDWGKGEEYVKLEELSEAELAHVKSQLKSCTLFYRDENDDQEVIDVVPRLPASFWDVKHSEWSRI
ncbi:uncharacterized protein EI90DRAFT_3071479 [Cantharellus anzutake]|uniref:uncharacterized protein n=1 Tax=Cantharellus anzutake TaxID=1750568 RepID=UPI0019065093|nr:uncharacterized protein EI90DRAFT_3071479 [Cantharellus anzutake]KAF8326095.1 hypothetical protein EI90DRAFT_3071479 [Cantharellus anzutake]